MTSPYVGDLAAINAAGLVSGWLANHPAVRAALDAYPVPPGVDDGLGNSRVRADAVPPWPMLQVVQTPGGSLLDLRYRIIVEVQITAWGDQIGVPGPAALQRLLFTALQAIRELPEQDPAPGQAVLTAIDATVPPQPIDDPSGQERWITSLGLHVHPPN